MSPAAPKQPIRATILTPGEPRREPTAELADGRVMPMGWNMGQTIPAGTTGTAIYIRRGNWGLWQFTPDTSEETTP